jgi:hypothetical protein
MERHYRQHRACRGFQAHRRPDRDAPPMNWGEFALGGLGEPARRTQNPASGGQQGYAGGCCEARGDGWMTRSRCRPKDPSSSKRHEVGTASSNDMQRLSRYRLIQTKWRMMANRQQLFAHPPDARVGEPQPYFAVGRRYPCCHYTNLGPIRHKVVERRLCGHVGNLE